LNGQIIREQADYAIVLASHKHEATQYRGALKSCSVLHRVIKANKDSLLSWMEQSLCASLLEIWQTRAAAEHEAKRRSSIPPPPPSEVNLPVYPSPWPQP